MKLHVFNAIGYIGDNEINNEHFPVTSLEIVTNLLDGLQTIDAGP